MTESPHADFRVEAFNVLNHPQYGDPAAMIYDLGSFGKITAPLNSGATGTGTARQLQAMLRVRF